MRQRPLPLRLLFGSRMRRLGWSGWAGSTRCTETWYRCAWLPVSPTLPNHLLLCPACPHALPSCLPALPACLLVCLPALCAVELSNCLASTIPSLFPHPLGYLLPACLPPCLQPVQLAVRELQYGLALLAGRRFVADQQTGQLVPVLARLMAFPRAMATSTGAAAAQLDSPTVQQAVADAAAAAAEARLSSAGAPAGSAADVAEKAKRAAYGAAMSARLQLLRCSLTAAARDVEAARLGADAMAAQSSGSAVAAAQARLHAIFMGELAEDYWVGWSGVGLDTEIELQNHAHLGV